MTAISPSIISIGYGRNFFVADNPERIRMELCAAETSELHMVVFTHRSDKLKVTKGNNNLYLYPTSSRSKLFMVTDAFLIARSIVIKNKHTDFTITTQDPFEAGVVGFLLQKFYGVKVVVQEHGDVFATPYWRNESLLNRVRYFLGLKILASADVVRVVSKRTKDYFVSLGIKRVTTLPVSIDTVSFIQAVPNPLVRQLFTSEDFVLLSVARFVPQKNLLMLIRAFSSTYAEHSHARLLLVGTGSEETLLKNEVERLFGKNQSVVVFMPWSADVAGLMKASDAYVLSSHYEGWGRVLIEAMVAGLPIVTTDVGCVGEVVRDMEHGLVVPLDDERAFTKALSEMIENKTLFESIKNNLSARSLETLPGTDIKNYGKEWVKTMRVS